MLSCIIRPSEACSKIEIRSIEVVVRSRNQIKSALQSRGTLSQAVTKKHNGPGVADRIRQNGFRPYWTARGCVALPYD